MNKAKQLYELQEVDLDIEHNTQALTQVKSQLGKDDDLVAARAALDSGKKRLADLEHQQKTSEWELAELGSKIAVVEKKLYGGSVKNPRELTPFQQDLEILKGQRAEREDKLLVLMMDVDSLQQDVGLKKSDFEKVEQEWRENQHKLSNQQAELETESAQLKQKRDMLASQIDSASLDLYEEMRRARQGQAVAKVVQGRCQGCRISLSMSDQQKARMGQELAQCSNCGRILYLS
jgi:predicted  nucleic acid-binding Zn-ribbon protein